MFSSQTLHALIMQGPKLFCHNGFCNKNLFIDIQTEQNFGAFTKLLQKVNILMYHGTLIGACFQLIYPWYIDWGGTLSGKLRYR